MTRCPRCQRRLPPKGVCAVHGKPSVIANAVEEPLPTPVPPAGYTLGRLIAAGGSALVYAVTSGSGAPAILKWGRWRDRDIHERFAREAAILRVLGSPLTPTYLVHGAHEGWPYLLMEDVPGETLAMWMARNGEHAALGEIVAILLRLARVLEAIHRAGYVHHDLKPENVVIGSHDTRILDFGFATDEADSYAPSAAAGTVHYIAPEQLRTGAPVDRRADIYSLGVMAFEMLAGQPPFVGERRAIEYQHQVVRPPALRDMRQMPQELEEVVLACLAKQPEARPQTAATLIERFTEASAYIQTLKGVGTTAKRVLGQRDRVVLALIEGGDAITVSRAITDVHGIIVRSRPGVVVAAFATQFHDAPLAVAMSTCSELAHDRCRIVVHATTSLVRRSAQGKPAFYAPEIDQPATWAPTTVFSGLVLTAAAAELAPSSVVAAGDVPGFFRASKRDRTDSTDVDSEIRLVGRDRLLQDLSAVAGAGGMLIDVFGGEGAGKTRVLQALVDRLRAARHEVIAIRGRRRLLGDRPDDERLVDALGGGSDLDQALVEVAVRRAIVVIDDVQHFSRGVREQLVRGDLAVTRVLASREALFEVAPGVTKRLAIELVPLVPSDAERLLRELLQPARLIPDVLLQRLTIRANGNPGLLVALARDIKHRGGIRRHEGSDDWYVAADEVDTLNAAPSAAWLAARGLEGLPVELAPVLRMAAGLGPKFVAGEVAAVVDLTAVTDRLQRLVGVGMLAERNGWFEFVDASLQDAIYYHALDERELVHTRALRYWLANRNPNLVGWLARLAYHATGCRDGATAAACSTLLAREARRRGEPDVATELEQRALASLVSAAPAAIAVAVRALDES